MTMQARLIDHSHDPIRSLYLAYRTCYSSLSPIEILERIEDERLAAARRHVPRHCIPDESLERTLVELHQPVNHRADE